MSKSAFVGKHTKFGAFITKCTIVVNIEAVPPHYNVVHALRPVAWAYPRPQVLNCPLSEFGK